ncbi:MAG: hypothetical protein ACT4O1_16110 [Gemmatimonadota bacterium]
MITLARDLIHEHSAFQDFVIAHELLHLRGAQPWTCFQGSLDHPRSGLAATRLVRFRGRSRRIDLPDSRWRTILGSCLN